MANKDNFGVVDELLRDIMKDVDETLESVPFGGKVFIASGDWRQILPVVRRGTRASIIGSCLKRSYLWNEFKVLHLTINMRVQLCGNASDKMFAQWLLDVGDGKTVTL